MKRYTAAARILPGKSGDFRAALGREWPAIRENLKSSGVSNFSLWQAADLVFAYGEGKEEGAVDFCSVFSGMADSLEVFSYPMRLMYEDIGVIREDKSLIRHRVFITKLKEGTEEEYKRRHDVLAEQSLRERNGLPNPGPDSNFTIWNANGHIFGYDEIDVTMEHFMTEEEKEGQVAWETRMLEIMSWVTNDVDWITGTVHDAVQKLASF